MERWEATGRLTIDGGRPLSVSEHSVEGEFPLHWHSYFEIEIVLSGRGRCVINDVTYDIGEKNLFFLTPTDFHYLAVDEPTRFINICFDESVVGERELAALLSPAVERAYRLGDEEYRRLIDAAALLSHEAKSGGECCPELLKYILSSILRNDVNKTIQISPPPHARGIGRAIAYLEIHFKEPITLAQLAAEAGYHPTYFSELFRRATGEGYAEALNKRRIGYARTLLAGGLSVADAAAMAGFGSLSGFLATFKRLCGTTPSEYKKRHAAKAP